MSRQEPSASSQSTARRGAPKEHVMYRADDLGRGKKTGKVIREVTRDSDDIEPPEDVFEQQDDESPPSRRKSTGKRVSSRRKSAPRSDEEEDEEGSVSMEIDEDTPTQYINKSRDHSKPHSDLRIGSASNRLQRVAGEDFDQIPSPSNRARSRSMNKTPVPSTSRKGRLSVEEMGGRDNAKSTRTDADETQDFDSPSNNLNGSSQMSFTQMNQEEEDAVDKENQSHHVFGEKTTVGGIEDMENFEEAMAGIEDRMSDRSDDDPMTNNDYDAPQDMEQDEGEPEEEQGEEIDAEQTPKPKAATKPAKKKKSPPGKRKTSASKPRSKQVKMARESLGDESDTADESGLRRSKRRRFEPLEWWRNEKVVYGRRTSGRTVVPVIQAIIRLPKDEAGPLSKKNRTYNRRGIKREGSEKVVVTIENPEEGWDDDTDAHGIVVDYATQDEVDRRVAFTAAMVQPRAAANDEFFYQKIFGDGEFIAAGQLIIPPKSQKPGKSTKDNTYVFYVIEGAVRLKIHKSNYILATGAMFLVPRGNMYYIQNVAERDARLFFAQARKIPAEDISTQETDGLTIAGSNPSP